MKVNKFCEYIEQRNIYITFVFKTWFWNERSIPTLEHRNEW